MTKWKRVRIEREELHRLVWSKPLMQLAKEFTRSDVGLVQICKKLDVPRPPQGYWARKHRKGPPALPPTKGPTFHEIIIYEEPMPDEPSCVDPRMKDLIANEKNPKNAVKVGHRLGTLHPLVEATRKHLDKAGVDEFRRVSSYHKGCLGMNVCKDSVPRSLRILDALAKALEKRGFSVESRDGQAVAVILDEPIKFFLYETTTRSEFVVTDDMRKKNPYKYYPRYVYASSGVLELNIDVWGYGMRKHYKDGKRKQLENRLNEFIIGLIKIAEQIKRDRIEQQMRQERERRERENREARQRQLEAEKSHQQKLEQDASNWQRAQQLRAFITAVEQKHQTITPSSELAGWVVWASSYADRLDPLSGGK